MHIGEVLYRKILCVMPIPCVDLLVRNVKGGVLLLKRRNEPASGHWWFPGGRIQFNETRQQAVKRKLYEECGLKALGMQELGTFDVILDNRQSETPSHGISTLYQVDVRRLSLRLDAQSSEANWLFPTQWLKYDLHPFVKTIITEFCL